MIIVEANVIALPRGRQNPCGKICVEQLLYRLTAQAAHG